ncbi:MAG: TonB-dependent receptor [Colwellia sp.]
MVHLEKSSKHNNVQKPIFKKSLLAIAMMGICATTFAQEQNENKSENADEQEVEVIEIRGTRGNLINARDLKRNADTVVDSITAVDIGSLPDRSVLEAIQRLPGVSVERFAGPDDPDHFSVEGSGAIIRGLTQTRSEFNGRDSFSASSSRGLSFQDVSPELMGGVDVYKSQTADMIEGGIGGTISLRTRKPFDSVDRILAFNLDYSYGDLAEKWSPSASALYSDQWEFEGGGRFGLLVNGATSQLYGESHGIQSDAATQYYASEIPGAEAFVGEEGDGTVWLPNAANVLKKKDDRNRKGFSTALQYENAAETLLTTFQYIRSDANLTWHEQAIKYQGGYFSIDDRRSAPLAGTEFTFDDRGVFESGIITENGLDGWRASGGNQDRIPRTWGTNTRTQWGHKAQFDSRIQDSTSLVEDFSLNLEWKATDNLDLSTDLQYIKAESATDDVVLMTGSYAGQSYDVTGDTPTLTLIDPWFGYRDENPELFAEGTAPITDNNPTGIYPGFTNDPAGDTNYFSDYNSYFLRSAMDHYERSEGDSIAIRFDGEYHIDDSFVTSIQMGVRYAERDQTVRSTSYNWNGLAPEYSAGTGWLVDLEGYEDDYELVDWSDFQGGGVVNVPGNHTIAPTAEYVRSVMGANPARQPYTSNASGWDSYPNQNADGSYGLFADGDINNTTETNQSIYLRLNFEGDDELRFNGNIGLRYIKLSRDSRGHINFPDLSPDYAIPDGLGIPQQLTNEIARNYIQGVVDDGTYVDVEAALAAEANKWVTDTRNYLAVDDQNFGNNTAQNIDAKADFDYLLPSLNIKVELTDEVIARFSLSKAVALPDIQAVRNQATLGASVVAFRNTVDPDVPEDEVDPYNSIPLGAIVSDWTGSGGHTELKPMESVQYDMGLEWYFSDVGQLSATIFHKDLSNYFIQGGSTQSYTNPETGITRPVVVSSTTNGGDGKLDGFEIAYQQFFDDFIPGFGIQSTYTYVDASGVPNNEESYDDADWTGNDYNDTGIRVNFDTVPLQGQSKNTFNFITMYEKDAINARIAYNWRSKYLLTTRDVISKAPLWYDDHGQLDASFFYNFDNVTVGIQGTNITNSTSKTIMILNDDMLETGRSWFESDRRISLVVRGNF